MFKSKNILGFRFLKFDLIQRKKLTAFYMPVACLKLVFFLCVKLNEFINVTWDLKTAT